MIRIPSNLHTHTIASDGENTAEEVVRAAIARGFESVGFSEHAPSRRDMGECMKAEALPAYNALIAGLKAAYAPEITVYLGTECDMVTPMDKAGLDYTIGSLHGVSDESGRYCCVDYSPEMLARGIRDIGGGDPFVLIERYLGGLAAMAAEYRPDILGHMDLYAKFNEGGVFFDEGSARYKKLLERAVGAIAGLGCIVEVNTGAMGRGLRRVPYPCEYALNLLKEAGAPVTVSSDAHSAANLDYGFAAAAGLLKKVGYKSIKMLRGGAFADYELIF